MAPACWNLLATVQSSDGIKEVFSLINVIEIDDFSNQLTQKTGNAENLLNDMNHHIKYYVSFYLIIFFYHLLLVD